MAFLLSRCLPSGFKRPEAGIIYRIAAFCNGTPHKNTLLNTAHLCDKTRKLPWPFILSQALSGAAQMELQVFLFSLGSMQG